MWESVAYIARVWLKPYNTLSKKDFLFFLLTLKKSKKILVFTWENYNVSIQEM